MAGPQDEQSDLVPYALTCTAVLALIVALQVLLHV